MATWHVYANPKARLIGIRGDHPPVTGGAVIDTFVHDGGTYRDRLRIAEERNSPMRAEYFEQGSWHEYQTFPATDLGYDEAIMSLNERSTQGTKSQVRLVTQNGSVVPHLAKP